MLITHDFGQILKFLGCVFFYRTCLYILFDKALEKKPSLSRVTKKSPSPKVEKFALSQRGYFCSKI